MLAFLGTSVAAGLGVTAHTALTTELRDGWYRIEHAHSGTVLAVGGAAVENGAPIRLGSWTVDLEQQWYLRRHGWDRRLPGPGVYSFENKLAGKIMTVAGSTSATDGDVHQWDWTDDDTQRWTIRRAGSGDYTISTTHSGKALETDGSRSGDRAGVQLGPLTMRPEQRWRIVPL